MAALKRPAGATQSEISCMVGGMPAAAGSSRAGAIRQRGAAIASMLGIRRPVYETLSQNVCAAQEAADELKHLEDDELREQMECLQELTNAAKA
mgnify:CR=1 FL=1